MVFMILAIIAGHLESLGLNASLSCLPNRTRVRWSFLPNHEVRSANPAPLCVCPLGRRRFKASGWILLAQRAKDYGQHHMPQPTFGIATREKERLRDCRMATEDGEI